MKKQYAAPMTETTELGMTTVIAASITGTISNEEYSGDVGAKDREDIDESNGWNGGLW